MKRMLFLMHRWLGVVLCLFMALWFLSGVVMMYVGYPKLTQQERLQHLPQLASSGCCISAQDALAQLPTDSPVKGLRLTSIGGDPVYVVVFDKNRLIAVDARKGTVWEKIDQDVALKSASAFMSANQVVRYIGTVDEDAWTHSRALNGHRPLHVVEVLDDPTVLLYISSATGEVVRDVSKTEQRWGWLGAWLHWLYMFRGGVLNGWWSEIVIYLSLISTALAITGVWVGVLRWRRRYYANGSHSPYRGLLARWHHWFGLVFGVLIVFWIFSGLMSMNPWKIFSQNTVSIVQLPLQMASGGLSTKAHIDCLHSHGFEVRELSWMSLGDAGFVLAHNAQGGSRLQPEMDCAPMINHDFQMLEKWGRELLPSASMIRSSVQQTYDWHYYPRDQHTMTGHFERPLPVLKLEFNDGQQTWLYLSPRSGAVVHRSDQLRRSERVLFSLLHSWDWLPLLTQRPLWDGTMILLSIGGFIVSVSGVVLGWRRLKRYAKGRSL